MLTAAEAAARLGVKRATLYAYVSRGLLHRQVALDGRTSLFDPDEIAAFRSERRPGNDGELSTVITTALTRVADDGLWFRGRDLAELVSADRDYEAVADWLWTGAEAAIDWPSPTDAIASARAAQNALPLTTTYIDRLRVSTTVASATDPLRHDLAPHAVHQAGRRLLVVMVDALPDLGATRADGRIADRLWGKLTAQKGSLAKRAALNTALASLVDHGLASSTLAARVAASARADPYSVVHAGLGVADGSLHGAASGPVHELFEAAAAGDQGPGAAATAVGEARKRLGHTPGFGHMVYREQDPRYGVVLGQVIDAWSRDRRVAVVQQVRDVVRERSDAIPNIDFALGALSYLAGMPATAGEAVFVIGRTAGWLAHAVEEYDETRLRFRPRARYVGERAEG